MWIDLDTEGYQKIFTLQPLKRKTSYLYYTPHIAISDDRKFSATTKTKIQASGWFPARFCTTDTHRHQQSRFLSYVLQGLDVSGKCMAPLTWHHSHGIIHVVLPSGVTWPKIMWRQNRIWV
jgi:hypothetical protein